MTRANTPASVSFRRFLPFSSWRAPARLHLKSQKSLVNSSLAGALQFCRSRNVLRQGKTRREYCRILKGLDAVWGHFCPSKPCLPLLIDGIFRTIKVLKIVNFNGAGHPSWVSRAHPSLPLQEIYRFIDSLYPSSSVPGWGCRHYGAGEAAALQLCSSAWRMLPSSRTPRRSMYSSASYFMPLCSHQTVRPDRAAE